MRKVLLIVMSVFVLVLSACGGEEETSNFLARKENYYISEDDTVIIDYKTDENGELQYIEIDRLLQIDEMIFYNTDLDYDISIDGFTGDVYTEAGYVCTDFDGLMVPVNIEVGNTRYMYNRVSCEYVEVDRDNEPKLGDFVRRYRLDETIPVSKDVIVSIVIFDDSSIERFIEVHELPHTMKMLGVFSIGINSDRDGFTSPIYNFYRDMAVFEQLIVKHQDYDPAMLEVQGFPNDINLMDFDLNMDFVPLIDDFLVRYDLEIQAVVELFGDIGVGFEDIEGALNEEDPIDTTE